MENKLLEFIKDIKTTLYDDKEIKYVIHNSIIRGDIVHINEGLQHRINEVFKDLFTMFDQNLDTYNDTYNHADVLNMLKEERDKKLIRLAQQLSQLEFEYNELIKELEDEEQV